MTKAALSGKHVVITRPLGQAEKLQSLIAVEGGEAILFPLIEISPLADYSRFDKTIAEIAQYDWVIFISSNAVQYGMPRLIKSLNGLPESLKFAAIGPATAAGLRHFGIEQVLIPHDRFDSESLLAMPQMQEISGKKCMIVRGVGGRDVLAKTLVARGALVTLAECYQRFNPQTDAGFLQGLWQNKPVDAIVVTSSEAMRHLMKMAGNESNDDLKKMQIATWLRSIVIFVNHVRIAEEAAGAGLNIHVADAPGDEAMLQCLIRTLNDPL
jgi:uroporphyrinogen-III synthase